ncbi:MAG: molybdenum cofactor guanylyltransferase [Desulfobulbus oligotrophicus]|jgi:molybdopterin-guanine dinucleotide biosynthesis protein A|nr:molybdenum cofactor guanylyltransferase [Desulfobulbus oligotrophicus]
MDGVPVWGCVLIGGKSRRMGRAKHLLEQDGITWIERTVCLLETMVEQVVIAGAGELPRSLSSIPRVDDVPGIGGPLAGILAVFRRYPQVSWLITACDQPEISPAALCWLLEQRQPGVMAILPSLAADGRLEPLFAYYDQQCHHLLETMAAKRAFRLSGLRTEAGVITPQPPLRLQYCWRNVNTPQELAQNRGDQSSHEQGRDQAYGMCPSQGASGLPADGV